MKAGTAQKLILNMISTSVRKTHRFVQVNEDTEVTNFGEHLLRRAIDEHFYDLAVRPRTLMGKHLPGIGMNQVYDSSRKYRHVLPSRPSSTLRQMSGSSHRG